MASELQLDSLEIVGFRAFEKLQINRFGRVNLIVGKNNVGKSSVLEAIRLVADRGSPSTIMNILRNREELRGGDEMDGMDDAINSVSSLFFGRAPFDGSNPPMAQIGPLQGDAERVTLSLVPVFRSVDDEGRVFVREWDLTQGENVDESLPALLVSCGENRSLLPLDRFVRISPATPRWRLSKEMDDRVMPYTIVSANDSSDQHSASSWDRITLTSLEGDVLDALRVIEPSVERLSLIGQGAGRSVTRTFLAKLATVDQPVPLKSLGEGMSRILHIALSLVNSKGGFVLIDEIENGIHYSVQESMWRMVFEVATRLGSQVFVTTHSWDCLSAFQEVAKQHPEEGVLIRLERRSEGIVAVEFDEEELAVVTREEIEVR